MDEELYLEIKDDYNTIEEFEVGLDYKSIKEDKRLNEVRVSVKCGCDTVAFMNFYIFFDKEINETDESLVSVADDELNSDSYEAMQILDGLGLLNRDGDSNLFFLLEARPISTIYLQHIAVRDDYRSKGIGGWLIRNLPDIIMLNYRISPGVIIVKLYPEHISWGNGDPSFRADLGDPDENSEMFQIMRKPLEANGYTRHEDTFFFYRDFAV